MSVDPQITALEANIAKVLLGKPDVIRLAVVTLLAEGHLLIEDAPGVGKTSLAKAIANSLDCNFTRLQFTPDMLPSDILGSSVFLPNRGEFEFRRGPIFTNVLLADEINRTTPRTQSALLEAMRERQVSIDGKTYPLEPPFFVLATQNPFEFEGTYPLAGEPARPVHDAHRDRLSRTASRARRAQRSPQRRAGGHAASGARPRRPVTAATQVA